MLISRCLTAHADIRQKIIPILDAALAAVADPKAAVLSVLQRVGDTLTVGTRSYDLACYRRIIVIGAGKPGHR